MKVNYSARVSELIKSVQLKLDNPGENNSLFIAFKGNAQAYEGFGRF